MHCARHLGTRLCLRRYLPKVCEYETNGSAGRFGVWLEVELLAIVYQPRELDRSTALSTAEPPCFVSPSMVCRSVRTAAAIRLVTSGNVPVTSNGVQCRVSLCQPPLRACQLPSKSNALRAAWQADANTLAKHTAVASIRGARRIPIGEGAFYGNVGASIPGPRCITHSASLPLRRSRSSATVKSTTCPSAATQSAASRQHTPCWSPAAVARVFKVPAVAVSAAAAAVVAPTLQCFASAVIIASDRDPSPRRVHSVEKDSQIR